MATSESHDSPPPVGPVNSIELNSVADSKIIAVSVYSGRAEVTRLLKFNVKTGQNQVHILGLPRVLDQDSFRVEGRGAATIHDVTISTITLPPAPTNSDTLKKHLATKKRIEKALTRARKSLASLETYLGSLKVEHLDVSKLQTVVHNYDETGGELDDKVSELEESLKETDDAIAAERRALSGPVGNPALNIKASIGVFADFEGEVQIALIYAVTAATWDAAYDIRVDMQAKDKPINLIYKAGITQSTGEDWTDVQLTLETAAPTFGLGVPSLSSWTLGVVRPQYRAVKSKRLASFSAPMAPPMAMAAAPMQDFMVMEYGSAAEENLQHRELNVSSKGNITATFTVPGLISIPSDGVAHNVTIVRLNLDATMSWVSVPKVDTKTHLNAKIKNASEYTLLSGRSSVYVDGSFISKSDVPLVSPEESFDCPLGLDPSIRITYNPLIKKVSQSGFYTKTTNTVFTQRITVFNSKSTAIDNLKVIEQVPVAEDALITVKLDNPALVVPITAESAEIKIPPPIKVASGVIAQWDGADESGADVEALGKDGLFHWICSVPSQGKINLVLQWEVTVPTKTRITGL